MPFAEIRRLLTTLEALCQLNSLTAKRFTVVSTSWSAIVSPSLTASIQPSFRNATGVPQKLGVTNGLNYARLNFGVALRRNLNALWVDVAIAATLGSPTKLSQAKRCELLPLNSGESQYFFLNLNDRVHDIKHSASGWCGITCIKPRLF